MAAITRIEKKIDTKSDQQNTTPDPSESDRLNPPRNLQRRHKLHASPSESQLPNASADGDPVKLSFSARRIADFALQKVDLDLLDGRLHLESERSLLPPCNAVDLDHSGSTWLSSLSLSRLRRLCEIYFETFNRIAPVLDFESFSRTLGVAVESGFGINMESCLVLSVMCLGSFAQHAWEEGGFTETTPHRQQSPEDVAECPSPQENIAALRFLDEGRKRIGFLLVEQDVRSCQYYLLSATIYAVLLRPYDEWVMTRQACMISASFWLSDWDAADDYHVDLQRRLFWTALMRETILTDELELPRSSLQDLEEHVPLPKFVPHSSYKGVEKGNLDEYYHCHYLAQIAVRIIMTRIRDELFYANPAVYLADELYHQLEQWRSSLPEAIRSDFDSDLISHEHPSQTLAVAMLQTRYWISVYHIGRPFLYKAIATPSELAAQDVEICTRSMAAVVSWFIALRRSRCMRSYMHLLFFVCGQYVLLRTAIRYPANQVTGYSDNS